MRINKQIATKVVGLFDDVVGTSKAASTQVSVPLALAPKPTGMGISIERTASTVAESAISSTRLVTPPLRQPATLEDLKLSRYYLDKLTSMRETNPQRYQEMADSGIFDLIREGKLTQKVFENIDTNRYFTQNFLKDIRKVHRGEPLIAEIPAGTNLKNIRNFVEEGEVGILNGKLYANQGGKAVEVRLSKEKFEELFPLINRFKAAQGDTGDCWLVSSIDNFMGNSSQRVELYKLMRQEGDDILIRYPNDHFDLRFVNGKTFNDRGVLCEGSEGFRMFEQSFIFHRSASMAPLRSPGVKSKDITEIDVIKTLQENPRLTERLHAGKQGEFSDAVHGCDSLGWEDWKRFFKYIWGEIKYEAVTPRRLKTPAKKLENWAKEKPHLVIYSCEAKPLGKYYREGLVNIDYDLYSPHAYAIKDYNPLNQLTTLSNPHHTEVVIEAPLKILNNYGRIAHFNSVV